MSADRCTTHHICDCKQAELATVQARIAELSTQLVKAEHDWSAEMAEKEQAIEERDNYRTMAEKVAYVHVGLVMERDAALVALEVARHWIDVAGDEYPGTVKQAHEAIDAALAQSAPAAAERRGREQAGWCTAYLTFQSDWTACCERQAGHDGNHVTHDGACDRYEFTGSGDRAEVIDVALDGGAAPESGKIDASE